MMKKAFCAIILLLCLSVSLGCNAGCQKKNEKRENDSTAFDYLTADLSEYIEIPESLYRDLHVEVNLDAVTEADVNDAIGNVLFANRSKTGTGKSKGTLNYGDMVNVWYRGYLIDETTGEETDLYGACNFSDTEPTEVSIGKGGYVSGFESALVGAEFDTSKINGLQKRSAGSPIEDGDTVYVICSGTKQTEDGTYEAFINQVVRYVNTEENRDKIQSQYGLPAIYGDQTLSFFDLVQTVKVGDYYEGTVPKTSGESEEDDTISVDATFLVDSSVEGEKLTVWYFDLQVYAATYNEGENNKIATAKTYFPINYGDEKFNGKTVYFDFYSDSFYNFFKDYDVPELSDTFLYETLGIKEAELSSYVGQDAVEKYRGMVRQQLEDAADLQTAEFNALWKIWNDGVSLKKYPEGEIDAFVKEYEEDLDDAIESAAEEAEMTVEDYLTYTYTREAFAHQYYESMSDADTVDSYILQQATDAAKEKLILYALAKLTDNVPNEEQWNLAYNDLVDNYLAYYLSDTSEENEYREENFDTEEEFEEAKAELRAKIVEYYGESFLRESGFYQFVMEALAKNVIEVSFLGRTD